ncbi:uncharacterized protein LOC130430086 [Triplophysa dalaica]|uniref:uncharacterized protein LOC130430086 n=1 Tax=Triplophysa dalaica TaxID=1582913 RepID=UPI0024DF56B7|nr:uncharacterized protein LOC130430086 [Triplophysa dalaica]XP_056615007.1 uncharacterized protein LOC130430086 [Triplophysa dalaica]
MCLCCSGVFGDEVKSVSVMEGHSVTLHTDLTHIQTHDEIEWRFGVNGPVIVRIKRSVHINPIYNNDKTEIFRDRVKMNNQTGDLTITHITSQHSGLYQLKMNIGDNQKVKSFSLTVYSSTDVSISESTQTPSSTSSESSVVTVQIVVISCVTAVVGCVMIGAALLMFFICRKHTNTQQEDQTHDKQNICCDSTFFKHNTQESEMTEVLYTYYNISAY